VTVFSDLKTETRLNASEFDLPDAADRSAILIADERIPKAGFNPRTTPPPIGNLLRPLSRSVLLWSPPSPGSEFRRRIAGGQDVEAVG